MSPEIEFALHLLLAAAGSYALILFIRKLLGAIDKGLGGLLTSRSPWKEIGDALHAALPVLPMIPAGVIFMVWPHELIIAEPMYRFLTGCVAGSVAANLYELVTRAIKRRAKDLMSRDSNGG